MLNKIFKRFLFTKGYLVSEDVNNNAFAVCYTLAKLFNIRIVSGYQNASDNMILDVAEFLGKFVPKPFYLNFPKSAREFSPDRLLYDQLYHYFLTYVCGDFSEEGHSFFEDEFSRSVFSENTESTDFEIITVPVAIDMINEYVENIFASTRPINDVQYELVKTYIDEFGYEVRNCACKDTAIRLLIDTRDLKYVELINLPDVIKLVDTMNYEIYDNKNIKKLNFLNQDRKFVTKVIDSIFENRCYNINIRDCFEKRAIWAGLLHHIHYKPKTSSAKEFVWEMHGYENYSVYSAFERAMSRNDIRLAVNVLHQGKGQGAILRELNYIISRCKDEDDIEYVINSINTNNTIILIQLIMQYSNYAFGAARTFKFTRYNKLRVHTETEEEIKKRKTLLSQKMVDKLLAILIKKLEMNLYGRLGKVYIDSNMYNVALPIQENISNGGYGVLPKGTRIHIEECKKIRAFTYW